MGRKAVWILGAALGLAVLATPAAAQVSFHVGIGVPPVAAGVVVGAPPYPVYPAYPPYYYATPYPYPYPVYAYPYRYYRYPAYRYPVRYGRPYSYRGPAVVHPGPAYGYRNGGRYYNNDIGAARTYRETPPVRYGNGRR